MKRCNCEVKKNRGEFTNRRIDKLDKDLQVVASKSRLELMFLLKGKPHCVCDLSEHTGMSQSLVSHHLSDLNGLGYVKSKRSGKFIDYLLTVKGSKVVRILELLIK